MAGTHQVPRRKELESSAARTTEHLTRRLAILEQRFPVTVDVPQESGGRVRRRRILAESLAQHAPSSLEIATGAACRNERFEEYLASDARLGEPWLGELALEPEASLTRPEPLAAACPEEPRGEERCLMVEPVRDLPAALHERQPPGHVVPFAQMPAAQNGGIGPEALAAESLRDLHSAPRGREALVGPETPEGGGCHANVEQRLRRPLGTLAEHGLCRSEMLACAADVHLIDVVGVVEAEPRVHLRGPLRVARRLV